MSYNKETGMYEGYIYKIYNDVNNKIYIGQTTWTIKDRWRQHRVSMKKMNYALYNAMNYHGIEHFNIVQVEKIECINKKDLYDLLNEKEIYWIEYFNSYKNGYNSTLGGDNISYKILKPVVQYDKNTFVLLNTFDSIVEAGEFIGDTRISTLGLISSCCKGKVKSVNGYIWRYVGDDVFKYDIYKNTLRFDQYDIKTGALINSNLCATQIREMLNIKCITSIYKNANNITKSAYGYIWKYNENSKNVPIRHGKYSKFNCYTLNDVFLKTYSSVQEVLTFTGLKIRNSIYEACKKENHFAGGYHWYYADDPNQPDKTKIITK